jgi:hypothetical protein
MRKLPTRRPSAATAISLLALFVALSGTGYAATGGNFILGQGNTATTRTSLSAAVADRALQVTNNSTAAGATALALNVASGKPPFTVNSKSRVTNLNADLLDGQNASSFLSTTGKAADAELLDGQDSSAFLPAGATAANADRLDGLDSTQFVQGRGLMSAGAEAKGPGTSPVGMMPSQDLSVEFFCPSNLASNGTIRLQAFFDSAVNVFYDNGGADPGYVQLQTGGVLLLPTSPTGEHYTIGFQASQVATVEIFAVNRASDCHVQWQGWINT